VRRDRPLPIAGTEVTAMLYYSLVFLVLALMAGILGFMDIALAASGIARILFVIFLVLFFVSLVTGRSASSRGRPAG
jgi:uncharacterized membrane protein YtjA (UPF0391 family)